VEKALAEQVPPYACFSHSATLIENATGKVQRYLTEISEERGKWGLEMRKTLSSLVIALMLGWSGAVHAGHFQYTEGYGKGREAYQAGDYAGAFREWHDLGTQGYAFAQFGLGQMYENGHGVTQSDVEAVKWYRLAAEHGLSIAQYDLGRMYANGHGVTQDNVEAVKWYRLAAEQEYPKAQFWLGYSYRHGEGVPQNDAEAVKWYRLLTEGRNYLDADTQLALVRECRDLAGQGNADAQFGLGQLYENSFVAMTTDYVEAGKWYRLAAEQGMAAAQYNLGRILTRHGVTQDNVEAVKWYRLAAEQGNPHSQFSLGYIYYDGKGVTQDYAEAAKWYRLAAMQGDYTAQDFLGHMYMKGKGVTQDYISSHMWYNIAAASGVTGADNRDWLAKRMTPAQIAEAQRMAREWMAEHPSQ